jgi:hypothetical protein
MKNNQKSIFDDMTVDVIPEGKESEYYTKEQSFELIKRVKRPVKSLLVFYPLFLVMMMLVILKTFIDFPSLFSIVIYILVVLVLMSIIIGIVMYIKFLKFVKIITKEEVPIKSE